jgi:hypothetical protein
MGRAKRSTQYRKNNVAQARKSRHPKLAEPVIILSDSESDSEIDILDHRHVSSDHGDTPIQPSPEEISWVLEDGVSRIVESDSFWSDIPSSSDGEDVVTETPESGVFSIKE